MSTYIKGKFISECNFDAQIFPKGVFANVGCPILGMQLNIEQNGTRIDRCLKK